MRSQTLLTLAGAAGLLVGVVPARAAPVSVPPGYALVWSDEFNRDGPPDPARWTFEHGFVRNGEMQWYQPDNARVKNGRLIIEARHEARPNPLFGSAAAKPPFRQRAAIQYTSASVTTKGLANWTYGRFEIRARITAEQGLWPALWFVGQDGRWPAGGEIDLMEYYQQRILANFAWPSGVPGKPVWKSARVPVADLAGNPNWDSTFHLWTMDWDAHGISLQLDGAVINRIDLATIDASLPKGAANPFRRPQYLIINLALGGQRGGPLKDTRFPSRFEVDYVRVYQRKEANR
ncbi:glycoside hydrolase family 16 protein [Parablastomonas sp. CN1-191]|uniref:glycoside hydrolase family 16 protein n=1 Tax=Parablastomonas sp. CN1-191 TaxID=3400908 RepID=UPI003BF915CF